jgi:hypothetical protein
MLRSGLLRPRLEASLTGAEAPLQKSILWEERARERRLRAA